MTIQADQLILAPMEGVVDALMRDLLTSINQFDLCITEFVRVVDSLVPKHVFYKTCPELHQKGYTRSGTPIRVQLLGQEPDWLAENAIRAMELGSHGIDLNFGCPAKAVNKSRGGAVLLKSPEQIHRIIARVKQAVGEQVQVSAKIRLGFEDTSLFKEIISAVTSARTDLLTVHARTKLQGYKPPAYWHFIGEARESHNIDIIANGEIWSQADAIECMKQAKTNKLMLGRGLLARPNLANVIKLNEQPMTWPQLCDLLHRYSDLELQGEKSFYYSSRMKQWLRYLKLNYPQAQAFFEQIKTMKCKTQITQVLGRIRDY
ncbi:tRNA-dihydrouridine synthase [Thalassomonas actiniarum]|uniref:tRNA-dihydrouridine(16) synthase n=1 Tax=Thalassomonas actiniarum TaxID=485447 RepID=A0AAE9YWK4_9GAMM|nr:tRNA-dihydrouridine synthase [Thalassomonas actiniarum]WDE00887.1 tRNA-dihydrouridine synthase [Thalassomonas actiniarum]